MPISPLDIHNKVFSRSLRGFNEAEVDEFLDLVIKDYEGVLRENKELQNKVNSLQEKLNHFVNIEDTLSKTIIVAQEAADEVKNIAKKEATLIIKDAEKNADRIVNEALSKSRAAANEVDQLRKQANVYRSRFRALLESQIELFNNDFSQIADLPASNQVNLGGDRVSSVVPSEPVIQPSEVTYNNDFHGGQNHQQHQQEQQASEHHSNEDNQQHDEPNKEW